jgi:hypothetical protein
MRRILRSIGATLAIAVGGMASAGSASAHGLGIQETNRTEVVALAAPASPPSLSDQPGGSLFGVQ